MASHGPFASKANAKTAAKKARKDGFDASLYKKKSGWCVSVTRR